MTVRNIDEAFKKSCRAMEGYSSLTKANISNFDETVTCYSKTIKDSIQVCQYLYDKFIRIQLCIAWDATVQQYRYSSLETTMVFWNYLLIASQMFDRLCRPTTAIIHNYFVRSYHHLWECPATQRWIATKAYSDCFSIH